MQKVYYSRRFNKPRSHDGFQEDEAGYLRPSNAKYADQRKVFDDLGAGVLKNAFEGNCHQTNLVKYRLSPICLLLKSYRYF